MDLEVFQINIEVTGGCGSLGGSSGKDRSLPCRDTKWDVHGHLDLEVAKVDMEVAKNEV